MRRTSGSSADEAEARRGHAAGRRARVLALIVLGVWAALLFDPVIGPTLLKGVGLIAGVLAIGLTAMGLGWVGFALFAAGERVLAWLRRSSRWPDG